MKNMILILSVAVILFGAMTAALGSDSCIVSGWPVTETAISTVGAARQVTLGAVSSAPSTVICFIDSRIFYALSSPGIGLSTTKMGTFLFVR
jgi:hypothetical protein